MIRSCYSFFISLVARSQAGELQSLRHKFQNQQSRLQEILVCLDVGMTYLYDAKQLKEYFAVSTWNSNDKIKRTLELMVFAQTGHPWSVLRTRSRSSATPDIGRFRRFHTASQSGIAREHRNVPTSSAGRDYQNESRQKWETYQGNQGWPSESWKHRSDVTYFLTGQQSAAQRIGKRSSVAAVHETIEPIFRWKGLAHQNNDHE